MLSPQFLLPVSDELVVDLFAGGGGASCGIEQAIGRHVDIAINHDPEAVSLHQANHPQTAHHVSDVFEVDPRVVTGGQAVGLLWASPDCTYHSKARGGKPHRDRNRARRRRGLAWVVCRWAREVRPRVIALENVEEFQHWGPLLPCGTPCPERRGSTFARWVAQLRNLGYTVEWRELRACDYGAPTIRKRLFLVARCDGEPIVWPQPTHAQRPAKGSRLKPWRTAAECIDWSIPCPSIFDRERPLADATLRRIAHGVMRYVVNAAEPYVVRIGHTGHGDGGKVRGISEPLSTVTSKAEHLLCSPTLVQTGYGEREGQAPRVPGLDKPLGTVVGGQKHAVVAAFLARHYTGVVGASLTQPVPTITTIDHHSVVTTTLEPQHGSHETRAGSDRGRRHRGKGRRDDLEAAQPELHDAVGAAAAGDEVQARLLDGEDQRELSRVPDRSASAGLVGQEGPDSGRHGHQPHRREQAQQPPEQPGAAVPGRESPSRLRDRVARRAGESAAASAGVSGRSSEGLASAGPELCSDRQGARGVADDGVSSGQPVVADHSEKVRALLVAYYGSEADGQAITDPLRTIPTRDRFGLVTVHGETYAIADIGMRMMQPRELYRAQGFPDSYVIDRGGDGRPLTKSAQVRMCGNSVCPPLARAIVAANYSEAQAHRRAA